MITATDMRAGSKSENQPTPGDLRWKIKEARTRHVPYLNSDTVGKRTGVKGPTVRAYEAGIRDIPEPWVSQLADSLGLPIEWFYDGKATRPPYPVRTEQAKPNAVRTHPREVPHINLVPYWGTVPAGNWESPPDEPNWIQVSDNIETDGVVAVRVTGNSMEPRLVHGQLICIKQDTRPRDGVITLARNQDNELTLKVLRQRSDGPGYELHSLNPDYGVVSAESWSIVGYAVSIEESNPHGIRP